MKEIIISLIAFIITAGGLVLLIGIFGCARVKVTRVTEESYKEGIRFYRPAPYLLITRFAETEQEKKEQTLKLRVLYLPDTSQEYAIRVTPGIGSITTDVTLNDGWNLIGINRTIDTKIPETITAISGGVVSKLPSTITADGKPLELEPGLYGIVFDEKDKGNIKELKPILQLK